MKKRLFLLLLVSLLGLTGCNGKDTIEKVTVIDKKEPEVSETKKEPVTDMVLTEEYQENIAEKEDVNETESENLPQLIVPDGTTLQERFLTPDGFARVEEADGSFAEYLRTYPLKADGEPVLLYDGSEKRNQSAHAAVFQLPIEDADLQQCADSIMRMYAEYFWHTNQHERIKFHFTNGFLCEYTKWKEGYRVDVNGNNVSWNHSAGSDASYETFVKYMRMVFNYAGTLSMDTLESETIPVNELRTGDVIIKGGSPGHVVMVVDTCINHDTGKKAFLLAQGYMPAQEFHVINNPMQDADPWYYEEELSFPLRTAEYTFADEKMVKRVRY